MIFVTTLTSLGLKMYTHKHLINTFISDNLHVYICLNCESISINIEWVLKVTFHHKEMHVEPAPLDEQS